MKLTIFARILFLLLTAMTLSACTQAESPFARFTADDFQSLQANGKAVLIDVHAVWCPTCKKQGEILQAFQTAHPQCELNILSVDFDEQKEWVTHFKAPRQSTLILFKEGTQRWFSVAETRADVIRQALLSHLDNC